MNNKKIRWGILSTAKIGKKEVIPALQKGQYTTVYAVASRNKEQAEEFAQQCNIPNWFGSYEEMLKDPNIDAVYIPLPNHLHFEWIKNCVKAGKHVLCEKPLTLSSDEIDELIALRDTSGLLIGEAFMVLHHPRWKRVKEMVQNSELGRLEFAMGTFTYNNVDPQNIRNLYEEGGGGLYDIGVYPTVTSRYVFGEEPRRVSCTLIKDEKFKIDRLASAILEFPSGHMTFTTSTQAVPFQRMDFLGTKKHIQLDMPFNTPADVPSEILISSGLGVEHELSSELFPACNHYTLQGDAFALSVFDGIPFAGSLENAKNNVKVIQALFDSAKRGSWVSID